MSNNIIIQSKIRHRRSKTPHSARRYGEEKKCEKGIEKRVLYAQGPGIAAGQLGMDSPIYLKP